MPTITRPNRPRLLAPGLLCIALLGAALVSPAAARAAVFTIADGDVAALKAAINTANANGEVDTIALAANGVYTLTTVDNDLGFFGRNGLPVLADDGAEPDLTINGNGATIARSSAAGTPGFRIFALSAGAAVILRNLTLTGGGSVFDGGAIENLGGTLTLQNCIVRDNNALIGGGGIDSREGTVTVQNSTLSDNIAGIGGGIYNDHGTLTVENSTLSGNVTEGEAGAIYNEDGTLTVQSSTLSGNLSTRTNSGGIFNDGGVLTLGNTLLQTGVEDENLSSLGGTLLSQGYNLSSDDGGGFLNQPTDRTDTDPMLDPAGLQNNGGPTPTIALLPGSPAIDAGRDLSGAGRDQRGEPRPRDVPALPNAPAGDGSDIGAFELRVAANVSGQVGVTRSALRFNRIANRWSQTVTLANTGVSLEGPILLVLDSLPAGVTLTNADGTTSSAAPPAGSPYKSASGGLASGASVTFLLEFSKTGAQSITFTPRVLAGPGAR